MHNHPSGDPTPSQADIQMTKRSSISRVAVHDHIIANSATIPGQATEKIAAMQAGQTHGPVVLANRYDGIDLAGNACRFLVMDDLPQGTSNYDVFRMNVVVDAAVSSLLAQRIEQGIGRGTRGGADHCVVVLVGSKLVGWIGRKKNLDFLTASTRVQLRMGQEVSEAVSAPKEFGESKHATKTSSESFASHKSQKGGPAWLGRCKSRSARLRNWRAQWEFCGVAAALCSKTMRASGWTVGSRIPEFFDDARRIAKLVLHRVGSAIST